MCKISIKLNCHIISHHGDDGSQNHVHVYMCTIYSIIIIRVLLEYGEYIAGPTQRFNPETGVLEENGEISVHLRVCI